MSDDKFKDTFIFFLASLGYFEMKSGDGHGKMLLEISHFQKLRVLKLLSAKQPKVHKDEFSKICEKKCFTHVFFS